MSSEDLAQKAADSVREVIDEAEAKAEEIVREAEEEAASDAQPLSIGIQQFNALYTQKPALIEASAVMALAIPVLIFFFAQRAFMRGVVITGGEK